MKHYSAERKESILRQMMAPTNKLVSVLAREHGISEQTLYTWRQTLKAQGAIASRWICIDLSTNGAGETKLGIPDNRG
ncbi:MAG: transposase [Herminiimonas sp.]|nr:transposase [Herminiimonas sp.]